MTRLGHLPNSSLTEQSALLPDHNLARLEGLVLVALLLLFGGSTSHLLAQAAPLRYVPVTPCRVADSRNSAGSFYPAISGGTSRNLNIQSGPCGIPATAQAYSLNVTVVPSGPLGNLTLWPTGQAQPSTTTLTSDGRVKAVAAMVPGGADGRISIFASNTTDVIFDISGYFIAATDPTGLAFFPVTPCRIADTRNPTGPFGGPSLAGGATRTFPIPPAAADFLGSSAQALTPLNLTVVPPGSLSYITAFPAGVSQPIVSNINDENGAVIANAAIVQAGTGGAINVFATNATDLIIDVNGYFAPMAANGLSFYPVPPCRVLDTRLPAGSPPISSTINVNTSVTGCGIPATAQAGVLTATVMPPGALWYLELWPQGQAQPVVSVLNAGDGAITSNLALVPTNNAVISVYPSNPTHLTLDTVGYFSPIPTPAITGLSSSSGLPGTTRVTLTGTNFGATQGTSTLTFNGTVATVAPSDWTATSIAATVPATATTGNIIVTVGGLASNAMNFTVLPTISSLPRPSRAPKAIRSPSQAPTSAVPWAAASSRSMESPRQPSTLERQQYPSERSRRFFGERGCERRWFASNGVYFTIYNSPVLTITSAHTGSFTQAQTGVTYQLQVANSPGAPATSGTVTVTEAIPAGLIPISLSGRGWTCAPNTLNCSRSDTLNRNASYPPITVTANVASNTPAQTTNQATVSGGDLLPARPSDLTGHRAHCSATPTRSPSPRAPP